jgi:hypothetical protein
METGLDEGFSRLDPARNAFAQIPLGTQRNEGGARRLSVGLFQRSLERS